MTSRQSPRDEEEEAAFKGMGHAITIIRERREMDREELASRCEMALAELEKIERGELDERWGDLRVVANGLDIPLAGLLMEAEGRSGRGGRRGR